MLEDVKRKTVEVTAHAQFGGTASESTSWLSYTTMSTRVSTGILSQIPAVLGFTSGVLVNSVSDALSYDEMTS